MLYVEGCQFTRMGLGLCSERSTASVFFLLAPSKCCERLQPPHPPIKPRTLPPYPLQPCHFRHHRPMQPFPVPRNQRLDPLAWCRSLIVVNVLRRIEVISDSSQTLQTYIVDSRQPQGREAIDVREEQSLKFVPLDIGEHGSLIPVPGNQAVHVIKHRALKLGPGAVAFVLESIEVNQRCNEVVALPEQVSHLVRQSRDGDIAANRDRPRFDSPGAQVADNEPVDELFFSWPFNRDRQSNQGRPPSTFFCHS